MSNKKNNTRRAAARNDRRPAARPAVSKRERRHRRELEAFEKVAPFLERAHARIMDWARSEQGERAAQRFEGLLTQGLSSALGQRGLSALLGYAERGLEASASEGEARSARGRAEERVALERVLAVAVREEELEQLRHRAAVAELEAAARSAEAELASAPEPELPEPELAIDPAIVEAMRVNARLHAQIASLEAALEAQHRDREEAEDAPPPMPEPQAEAEAELAKLRDRLKEISISAGHALAQGAPAETRLRALRAEVAHLWRTSH